MNGEGSQDSKRAVASVSADHVVLAHLRPGGSVVLQGSGTARIGDDNVQYELSGVVQPEHIRLDKTVLSEHVADLRLETWTRERF